MTAHSLSFHRTAAKPRLTLYFWRHAECGVCAVAEPVLDAWKQKHPDLFLIKLDVTFKEWEKYGFNPKGTPAYLLTANETPVWKFVGGLRESDLNKMWKQLEKEIAAQAGH